MKYLAALAFMFISFPAHANTLNCEELFRSRTAVANVSRQNSLEDRLESVALARPNHFGLSETELQETIELFKETGAIGGRRHLDALLAGEKMKLTARQQIERALVELFNSDAREQRFPKMLDGSGRFQKQIVITKADLWRVFRPYFESKKVSGTVVPAELWIENKSKRMAASTKLNIHSGEPLGVALADSRKYELLQFLYDKTMTDAIHSAVDAAPGGLQAVRILWPRIAFGLYTRSVWGGVFVFSGTVMGGHYMIGLAGFAAAMSGVIAHVGIVAKYNSPFFQRIRSRYRNAQQNFLTRATGGDAWLAQEKLLDAPSITKDDLKDFNFAEDYSSLSIPLRVEVEKIRSSR